MRACVVWLCAAIVGVAPGLPANALAVEPARPITETKERLDATGMEALVAAPMKLARKGDWSGAQRSFEQVLEQRRRKHGPTSIEVADTLNAFMILNFMEDRQEEAFAYSPRAIDAVRSAWGSDHLEYALLLNDVVQMDYVLHKDAVGPQSEAALIEAYRIRVDRLGPKHKESIATLIYLGEIQGLRSRTGGNLARAAPAIATLRKAIADSEESREPGNNDNLWARGTLAETFVRNGALGPAVQTFNKLLELAEAQGVDPAPRAISFAETLQENGFYEEARPILEAVFKRLGLPIPAAAAAQPPPTAPPR